MSKKESNKEVSEERLKGLESKVNVLKEKKIRTEEKLKNLRKQKDDVIADLTSLGVTPKDLSNVIEGLETKIGAQFAEIDAQIPKDISDNE